MVLKIDYDTEKLQKVTYDVIIWCYKDYVTKASYQNDVTKFFPISSPSLSNILVALLCATYILFYFFPLSSCIDYADH